jgi:hypothetical protein
MCHTPAISVCTPPLLTLRTLPRLSHETEQILLIKSEVKSNRGFAYKDDDAQPTEFGELLTTIRDNIAGPTDEDCEH